MIKPIKVDDVALAFGGNMKELLPNYNDIPEDFKKEKTKWNKFVQDWFFNGLKELNLEAKDGIDIDEALRHIKAIMASFEPKHEHKMAGCAYLLSEFFDKFEYTLVKK